MTGLERRLNLKLKPVQKPTHFFFLPPLPLPGL